MNCLNCKKQNLFESMILKRYSFKLFPFSKSVKCNECETKHDIIFLFCTPRKINYLITKRIAMPHESYIKPI